MDPIADALIRIKNGYSVGKKSVSVKYSKLNLKLMALLQTEGYLEKVEENSRELIISLKYSARKPAIVGITRISKPSQRVYKGAADLPRVLNGLGIAVISTPKGLMTGKEAKKLKIGGEVLAFVW